MPQSEARFLASASSRDNWPENDLPEVVVVGRSNVGKSSFINALLNQKNLAFVGKTPGKTQLLNFFTVNDQFVLVDVPGYGFAKLSKTQLEKIGKMMEDYFNDRENIRLVVSLIDARRGQTENDREMTEYLMAKGYPILYVITKMDKIPKSKRKPTIAKISEELKDSGTAVVPVSSLKKYGFDRALEAILDALGLSGKESCNEQES